ncbi:MAG: DUF2892 domain-containing protein [Eudoraea sp.]|uniref:YgaP family membrane protein n=1 Tax=Eudoraea sp. TaxID=1979955 RepID=UPI003263A167
MKKNMGSLDRIIRFIVAAIIVVLVLAELIGGTLAIVLMVLAGVFVLTGFVGFCPLYKPFGISTCTVKQTEQKKPPKEQKKASIRSVGPGRGWPKKK